MDDFRLANRLFTRQEGEPEDAVQKKMWAEYMLSTAMSWDHEDFVGMCSEVTALVQRWDRAVTGRKRARLQQQQLQQGQAQHQHFSPPPQFQHQQFQEQSQHQDNSQGNMSGSSDMFSSTPDKPSAAADDDDDLIPPSQ